MSDSDRKKPGRQSGQYDKIFRENLEEHTKGDLTESRYFNQLRIFVKLRSSIQPQFEKVMQSVSLFFKEEEDFLYKRGEEKGAEKERAKAEAKIREERAKAAEEKRNIARHLKKIGVSIEDIAKATGLPSEEVEGL